MKVLLKSKTAPAPVKTGMRFTFTAARPATVSTEKSGQQLREEWLSAAARDILTRIGERGAAAMSRVSCGWAYGSRGTSERRRSECWMSADSADGRAQIFISPAVDDGAEAYILLAHELCHAVSGDEKHGDKFEEVAVQMGFTTPFRDAVADKLLQKHASDFVKALGAYPHSALHVTKDASPTGYKKDTCRQLKCVCPASGYTCRTTRKWIEQLGAPISPKTGKPMEVVGGEEGGAE
jgi:hypothetical protein